MLKYQTQIWHSNFQFSKVLILKENTAQRKTMHPNLGSVLADALQSHIVSVHVVTCSAKKEFHPPAGF